MNRNSLFILGIISFVDKISYVRYINFAVCLLLQYFYEYDGLKIILTLKNVYV